jgi:hypothetical protein
MRVNATLLAQAKKAAHAKGKSLGAIVRELFERLGAQTKKRWTEG